MGLAIILLNPLEASSVFAWGASTSIEETARMHELVVHLADRSILLFASGALWSGVGMLASAVSENAYVARISPFIACYLLIIFKERYFANLEVMYPKEWLSPGGWWPLGSIGVIIWLWELAVILVLLFLIRGEKRLSTL